MRRKIPIREKAHRSGPQSDGCIEMIEYTDSILIKLKPGDRKRIYRRMEEAGIDNMSAFMRKMAIDGYVIKLDLSDINEFSRILRINANNLNQYAKKANQTGNIYLEDIKELQKQQEELWKALKEFLKQLSTLT